MTFDMRRAEFQDVVVIIEVLDHAPFRGIVIAARQAFLSSKTVWIGFG